VWTDLDSGISRPMDSLWVSSAEDDEASREDACRCITDARRPQDPQAS